MMSAAFSATPYTVEERCAESSKGITESSVGVTAV